MGRCGDEFLDLTVGRRNDLRAPREVDLGAVVAGRIVGCRDLDTRDGVEIATRERHQRRRTRRGNHDDAEACRREDLRRRSGELLGTMTGITTDHDRTAPVSVLDQPRGKARRRSGDDCDVHSVGARAHRATQPRGAEP